MGKGSQIFLGIVFALAAILFASIGSTQGRHMPKGATPFYGTAAFCAVVALACLVKVSRPLTLRIIGAALFLAFAFYAYDSFGDKNFAKALAGCVAFGFPGAYLAVTGNYPSWGKWGVVLGKKSPQFRLSKDQIKPLAKGYGACIATDKITVDGYLVRFMYRETPDNDVDSGWRFMSGYEDDSYMDDPDNHAIYDVNTIANYDPSIIPFLDAPQGSAFEKTPESERFLAVADWVPGEP